LRLGQRDCDAGLFARQDFLTFKIAPVRNDFQVIAAQRGFRRAAANPIGRNVKLADLTDNCDLSRISEPTDVDYQRIEKYRRAIKLIHAL
jgi:hypothetical protein